MRMAVITTVFLLMVVGCTGPGPPRPAALLSPPMVPTANGVMSKDDIAREVRQLRASLLQEVPQHSTTDDDATWIAGAKAAVIASRFRVDHVQLMVVVDRNPAVQQMRIILAQPDGQWQVIGGSKVSTGQSGRRGYFITPLGVFLHTDDILDYRALGTFNENHIRGLGLKGCECGTSVGRPRNAAGMPSVISARSAC